MTQVIDHIKEAKSVQKGLRYHPQPTKKFITIPRALRLLSLRLTPDLCLSCRKRQREQYWTNTKSRQKIDKKVHKIGIFSLMTQYNCRLPILSFELKFVIFLISRYDVSNILRVLIWGLSDFRCRELLLKLLFYKTGVEIDFSGVFGTLSL